MDCELMLSLSRSKELPDDRKGALAQLMSGYEGETIFHMVPKLLKKTDYDLELAKRGIVFLDNMDRVGLNSDCGDSPEGVIKETLAEIFQVRCLANILNQSVPHWLCNN